MCDSSFHNNLRKAGKIGCSCGPVRHCICFKGELAAVQLEKCVRISDRLSGLPLLSAEHSVSRNAQVKMAFGIDHFTSALDITCVGIPLNLIHSYVNTVVGSLMPV